MTKKDEQNLRLLKYSDYANDMVLADILSYLLLEKSDKVPFLNNSNMEGVGNALRRLIAEIEYEMGLVRKEKDKLSRGSGLPKQTNQEKYLDMMLKTSRFKKTLQVTHRHKLSLPDVRKPVQNPNQKHQRFHLKKRYE